jgi:hypothetical protein
MKVQCEVVEVDLENDEGRDVPSVAAECSRCGHSTESFGTDGASVRRCLVLMREECPKNERNFYIADED